MKKKNLIVIFMLIAITSFTGCASKEDAPKFETRKITSREAKEMIDQNTDIIILDVRTAEEYNTGYIEGAILLPDNEIVEKAAITLNDKDATILVYCRSGRRSALAAAALNKLGYSNVYDFGGIIDWTYGVVTD